MDDIMKLKAEQENRQITTTDEEYDLDEDDAGVQNKNSSSRWG